MCACHDFKSNFLRTRRRHLLWLPVLLLLLAIGISINTGGTALAGRLTDLSAPAPAANAIPDAKSQPQDGNANAPSSPQNHAYMTLEGSSTDFGNYCAVDCTGSTGCRRMPSHEL